MSFPSSSPSSSPFHGPLRIAVYSLAFLGLYGTWGRALIDGSLARLLSALHGQRTYTLPGTNEQLKTIITGVYWPIDYLFNIMIVFFWEVVDGSHPSASAIGLYFVGQYLSIVTAMYIDSYRASNVGRWKQSPTLWLLLFQLITIGTAGPWFVATYLINFSTTALSLSLPLTSSTTIFFLPISILIGYVIPSILMALPSPFITSNTFQQLAIAAWSIFPLYIFLSQTAIMALASSLGVSARSRILKPRAFLSASRITYAISFILSTISHIAFLALTAGSLLFPSLFAPIYASSFRPITLLLPPTSWAKVSSMGEGVTGFMQWDQLVGYTSMLLLAGVSFYRTKGATAGCSSRSSVSLAVIMVVGCSIVGPGSTYLAVEWARNELLLKATASDGVNDSKNQSKVRE